MADKKKIMADMRQLADQIDELRYRYHVLNDPEVTDQMYEGLMRQLCSLEEEHPTLRDEHSPTQRVAGMILDGFEKINHPVRQWSLQDAFDKDDMHEWEQRLRRRLLKEEIIDEDETIAYNVELKIDGLHIVLVYKNGVLASAATRGDGKVGENVTANIRTIQSIPLKINETRELVIEGEVWMHRDDFATLNQQRETANEPLFANPRNAAAGTIRQLDTQIVAERNLCFTAYEMAYLDQTEEIDQSEKLQRLAALKFPTEKHSCVAKSIDDIFSFYHEWKDKKETLDFWIDGLVIKVNDAAYRQALGYTGKAPRWATALKFPAEQGTTRIEDIYVQVGRTGVLTPVALLEAVHLSGSTVTHATLHNFEEIERLDVRIGDMVVVEKAGDIIPKIVRVLDKMRTGKEIVFPVPSHCPMCEFPVEKRDVQGKKEKSAGLFCPSNDCYSKKLQGLIHFVSKKAFNIDGLGKKIVEQLLNEGLIKDAADLFHLAQGDIQDLEGFGELSAQNLIDAIQAAKEISFARFLFALGISNIGEETAIRLANHFPSLEALMQADEETLQAVHDVGTKAAEAMYAFFQDDEKQAVIREMLHQGVTIIYPEINQATEGIFTGKTVVLTGTLEQLSRDDAKEKIRAAGGQVGSSVSKKTDYLVVGAKPGSKLQKAENLGVEVLSEEKFLDMLI